MNSETTVLVLGASGMLGNAVFRLFAESDGFITHGTVRNAQARTRFRNESRANLHAGVDVEQLDHITALLAETRPNVIINCVGVVKQKEEASDPLVAIPLNSLMPHRIARLSALANARFIHISTDCVFRGDRGSYTETDHADSVDLYGRSKLLGEVDYGNAVTLRTSIIGHELSTAHGLVEWFLQQHGTVKGFTKAIFSGLPTVELARVIRDFVLPKQNLRGVFHVSAAPINKYDLLHLLNAHYGKNLQIVPDGSVIVDRSLNSSLFRAATGYRAAPWDSLVSEMHQFR
jgi:dTDP-4-dehydrorhamnose reductase